jgi:hypothetical protein
MSICAQGSVAVRVAPKINSLDAGRRAATVALFDCQAVAAISDRRASCVNVVDRPPKKKFVGRYSPRGYSLVLEGIRRNWEGNPGGAVDGFDADGSLSSVSFPRFPFAFFREILRANALMLDGCRGPGAGFAVGNRR